MFRVLLSPRLWGLHLLAIVATVAAVWLGVWQYDAWQTRREAQAVDLAHATPRPLQQVMTSDAPFPGNDVGRPVTFRGTWVPESTVYVANRPHAGARGVWAVTPVAVCGDGCDQDAPAMLVVRGWAPDPQAAPPPPNGQVAVTGWLQPPEGSGLTDRNPRDDLLPELRIADAIQHVDQDLYGAYVIAQDTAAASHGALEPVTPASLPQPDSFTALRNLLYALEWWVFGGFAVFVWWRWCRDEVRRAREETVTTSTAGTDQDSSEAGVPSRS